MYAETDTQVPQGMNQGIHPGDGVAVKLVVGQDASVYIFHDKPFSKELSWIEYDLDRSNLDFIMDDGDIRNFGIPVDPKLGAYMQNIHSIGVVLAEGLQTVIDGAVFPLIIHRA